jgi:hypothetical protein
MRCYHCNSRFIVTWGKEDPFCFVCGRVQNVLRALDSTPPYHAKQIETALGRIATREAKKRQKARGR